MSGLSNHPLNVVIVGAGPSGSVCGTAIKAAIASASVTIIDREHFPRDKACGDGLGPGVRRTLVEVGIADVLNDYISPASVRVTGPDDTEGYARGPVIGGKDLSGNVAPRLQFDGALLKRAEEAGVIVQTGVRFRRFQQVADGSLRVTVEDGDGEREILADVLVGADGAYSEVRKAVGVPAVSKRHTHIAMRSYTTLVDPAVAGADESSLRLDFTEKLLPAYGWVFPLPNGRANVGVGLPLTHLDRRSIRLRTVLDDYYLDLKRRGFIVGDPEDVRSHLLPHAAARIPLVHGAVVLIGDAAGMINPLSGEGIFYGMAAGQMLAQSLGARLQEDNNIWIGKALSSWERSFNKRFRRHFLSCWISHQLLRSRLWARLVIRATSRDPKVMENAATMLFDEQAMKPSTALRVMRSGL